MQQGSAHGDERVSAVSRFVSRFAGVAAVVALLLVLVVYSGTLLESRWTGSMASCQRAVLGDSVDTESGEASMRWMPPEIHCEYGVGYLGDQRIVSSTEDHIAVVGVFSVAFLLGCIAVLGVWVLALRALVRWSRRRVGLRDARI